MAPRTMRPFGVIADVLRVIARPYDIVDPATDAPFRTRGGAVSFERVTFAYPGGREVFHDFDLHIAAGETVGLAGPSGSDKTTLAAGPEGVRAGAVGARGAWA